MVANALEDVRTEFRAYQEREVVARGTPLSDTAAGLFSTLARDLEQFLLRYDHALLSPEAEQLMHEARGMYRDITRILETVGIDGSWGLASVDSQGAPLYHVLVLNPSSSAIVGEQLDNPPPLSPRLRQALEKYRDATAR